MALYLRKRLDNKAEIAVWQVTETEEELLNLTSVPNDELEEIQLFRNESQRKQKLAVRALLNEIFEEKMYLNHHDNGKPYLENSAVNISITHTDNYVAVITHDTEEVGVDIESLDRDFAAVEKKALSEDEIDDLDDDKTVEFIRNFLPVELKEKFTDDDLYYIIDVIADYYFSSGLLDAKPDDEGCVEIDIEKIVSYIIKEAKKDKIGDWLPEDIELIVQAEMEYGNSLGQVD